MQKFFCDRCKNEIIKDKELQQYKLTHLWTFGENKENDSWELCQYCSKRLLEFLGER